ncbi:unnamed protein product [Heterobilharzia americana]|nr:unnamed protein product [Heterobilharzia americana]
MNENGQLFAEFYAFNELAIGGEAKRCVQTRGYSRRDMELISPDGHFTLKIRSTLSQCEESGDAVRLLDARSRRRADAGLDHSLSSTRNLPNGVESLERS